MKTSIIITGSRLMSKRTLLNACTTPESETEKLPFNCYKVVFYNKKQAVNALSSAYQHLKSDKEDWPNSNGSYLYGDSLSYDAGNAQIKTKNL